MPRPDVPLIVFPTRLRIKAPEIVTFCPGVPVIQRPPVFPVFAVRVGWLVKVPLKTALSALPGTVPPQFVPVLHAVLVVPVHVRSVANAAETTAK
jgi:hypothetical protein